MPVETQEVHYPRHPEPHYVIVERLSEDSLSTDIAQNALHIVTAAYAAEFEGPQTAAKLSPGTMENHFQPEDIASVRRYQGRMEAYLENGSAYWLAKNGSNFYAASIQPAVGLIKVSPSRATLRQKLKLTPPNLYLNDIVVSPNMQDNHIGTDMIHTVTKFGGYSDQAIMVLDGFVKSQVNDWFKKIGLQEHRSVKLLPFKLANGQELDQLRFESGLVAVRGITRSLERFYGHVRDARPVYKT